MLDGEIVAFNEAGLPHWPLVCQRVLHGGDDSVGVTYVMYDLLAVTGE